MHRSRFSLLLIVSSVAACSTQKDPDETKTQSLDSMLVARLDPKPDQKTDKLPFPDVCGAVAIPDEPSATNKAQAAELTRRAYDAEVLGNIREASSLLHRASALDWTDKSAAYHLGRVSESLGKRSDAIKAYCRYLALAPTMPEQAEAYQRVNDLSQSQTRVAAGTVIDSLSTHRRASPTKALMSRNTPTSAPRVVARATVHSSRTVPRERRKNAVGAIVGGAVDSPSRSKPPSPETVRRADTVVAESESVAVARPAPTASQPSATSPVGRRGPSRVQGAGIGAVAGAIIGGAASGSVKGAAIGAVAGGILGAAATRGIRGPSGP